MSNLKDFINGFKETSQAYIAKFQQIQGLSNDEKKARLDDVLTTYATNAVNKLNMNFVVKLVFKKLLIPNIPHLTQAAFDLIKAKVDGVTK